MKPVFMQVTHDPPTSYGDCFRCCVASILEVEAHEIPHPYDMGENHWDERYKVLEDFLAEVHGVWLSFIHVKEADLKSFFETFKGFVLLGGKSPRGPHLVVADNRGIVHNPNPLNDGLIADDSGFYQIGFLCRGVK